MIRSINILMLFLLFNSIQAQDTGYIKEIVNYQYDKTDPGDRYIKPDVIPGKEILVFFDCCFNDSVQIFKNGQLILSKFLKTDPSLSFTGLAIKIKFEKPKTILKIILPGKKVFCEITLNNKYYTVLNINRMEDRNPIWWITFRNYVVYYE